MSGGNFKFVQINMKDLLYYPHPTVLPAKSDSDVMFCYKVIKDLESINHLCKQKVKCTS